MSVAWSLDRRRLGRVGCVHESRITPQLGCLREASCMVERLEGAAAVLEERAADRDRDPKQLRAGLDRLVCEEPAQALCAGGERRLVPHLGREHDELLAAPAIDAVRRAKPRAQPVVHGDQKSVAGRVAVAVVHVAETVGVQEEDSGCSGAARNPRLLGHERFLQRVPVERARERVRARPRPLLRELRERAAARSKRDRGGDERSEQADERKKHENGRHGGESSFYLISVSILNIGMYMAITIVPTITPTPIISTGSMIEVSDWMLESTSSS